MTVTSCLAHGENHGPAPAASSKPALVIRKARLKWTNYR
jgi:hypothetical protein